jgi:hypothetical protein
MGQGNGWGNKFTTRVGNHRRQVEVDGGRQGIPQTQHAKGEITWRHGGYLGEDAGNVLARKTG